MSLRKIIVLPFLISLFIFGSCNSDTKIIPAPEIFFKMTSESIEVRLGDTLILSPKITYEIEANYQWFINDSLISEEKIIHHSSKKLGKINYKFVVKTPYGQDSISLPVATIIKINFDELELPSNSYDVGSNLVNSTGGFISQNLFLPVNPLTNTNWRGFALSNIVDKQIVENPQVAAAYATVKKENNFMIYSQPQTANAAAIEFVDGLSYTIGTILVANTQLSYLVMKYGTDNGIRPFGGANNDLKDWSTLIIEGFDAKGALTDTVHFYLADYRFANKRHNYILGDWSTVDLQKLGKVSKVVFTINSSIIEEESTLPIPRQFCLDDIKLIE